MKSPDADYENLTQRASEHGPSTLYRFRNAKTDSDIAGLRELIVNRRIRTSSPLNFNDPFDCFPSSDISGTREQRARKLQRSFLEMGFGASSAERRQKAWQIAGMRGTDQLHDYFETGMARTLVDVGVLCFSEVWDNVLMWSHYCGSHTGVCLGFRRLSPMSVVSLALPVHYDRERPVIDLFSDSDEARIRKAIYTKSEDWAYEKEWRTFLHRKPAVQTFAPGVISDVILGAKMDRSRRAQVIAMASEANVLVRQATFHRREWKLVLQDPTLFDEGPP